MSDQALIIRDDSALAISLTAEAERQKEVALESAALIGKVNDAASNEKAVLAQSAIKGLLNTVEKARKAAKEPVLEFGRKIDDSAKLFADELNSEMRRISELVGEFQEIERQRIAAAERAARLESERIEAERQAEQRRIWQAEQDRLAVIAKQERAVREQAAAATNKKEREAAAARQLEIDRQKALAASQTTAALDAAQEKFNDLAAAQQERAPVVAVRAAGQVVASDWEITVTDIHTLARVHPGMVKIEPLMREIKAALKAGAKVTGIIAKPILNTGVRAPRQTPAIEA